MSDILSPERIIDRLVAQDIFADLDPVSLRVIALASETIFLEPGDILFHENDPSDGAYFVIDGIISLRSGIDDMSAQGGDMLHSLALIAELERPGTAVAAAPSEVLNIPRQVFLRILESAPAQAVRLRDKLTRGLMHRTSELQPTDA